MASEELSTYFLYSDGIDPSILNLGAMVLDFKSPKQCEPYRHPQLECVHPIHSSLISSTSTEMPRPSAPNNYKHGLLQMPLPMRGCAIRAGKVLTSVVAWRTLQCLMWLPLGRTRF